MAVLDILHFPDTRLRIKAEPVQQVDTEVQGIVKDMFETMYAAPGIGLAATQVNIHRRIIVLDVSPDHDEPLCLINPELLSTEGEGEMEEGCLSVPGYYESVKRAERIRFRALNEQGESFTQDAEGLLAVCVQHEMDHLDGKLFVDYLSNLKRSRIRSKLEKQSRHGTQDTKEPTAVI